MIDTPRPQPFDLASLRRAFAAADHHGEAALNWLLYGSAALLMSAVVLVTPSPAVLGVAMAIVPWLALAVAAWLWISPVLREQSAVQHELRGRAERARVLAAEILLDDDAPVGHRRAAAEVLLNPRD